MTKHDDLLTRKEACALLNVSARTLYRYEEEGHITALLLPSGHRRFRRIDVEALLAVTP